MSVAKLHHDAIPVTGPPATPAAANPMQCRLKLLETDRGADEFWAELNRTLDDFFSAIQASNAHIQRLTERLAEREIRIEELTMENSALREQLPPTSAPSAANEASHEPPLSDTTATAALAPARRSIWSRLSGLERDPTPVEYHFDRRRR